MKLILASGSPRRSMFLSRWGFEFGTFPANAAETAGSRFDSAALENAFLKADSVSKKFPDSLVLGADTVIEFEHGIIGKPRDRADALAILLRLSGKTHTVTTGVCILSPANRIRIQFAECSRVTFRPFDSGTAERYFSLVNVLDKAGAYALQEHPELIIERTEGDESNIIGLPSRTAEALRNAMCLCRA